MKLTKEERKNRDKEINKIVTERELFKAEYIGDYKGSNVYAGFPGSGKDSPVLILWNREETQVVSGKQTAEILNTILDLNNREILRQSVHIPCCLSPGSCSGFPQSVCR